MADTTGRPGDSALWSLGGRFNEAVRDDDQLGDLQRDEESWFRLGALRWLSFCLGRWPWGQRKGVRKKTETESCRKASSAQRSLRQTTTAPPLSAGFIMRSGRFRKDFRAVTSGGVALRDVEITLLDKLARMLRHAMIDLSVSGCSAGGGDQTLVFGLKVSNILRWSSTDARWNGHLKVGIRRTVRSLLMGDFIWIQQRGAVVFFILPQLFIFRGACSKKNNTFYFNVLRCLVSAKKTSNMWERTTRFW